MSRSVSWRAFVLLPRHRGRAAWRRALVWAHNSRFGRTVQTGWTTCRRLERDSGMTMRDRAGAHGRVETVMRQMETSLLDGTWRAGAKLPSERVLAQEYGVARNTVREAIQRLAARGLVASRAGAGVFVTDQLRTGFVSPWGQLVADHPALRDDILEFRRVLEGATAYFAALRASDEDL